MGDNLDKTETGETLESGLNEAGNLASEGLDIANKISDKKIETVLKILPDKKMSLVILVTRQKSRVTRKQPERFRGNIRAWWCFTKYK